MPCQNSNECYLCHTTGRTQKLFNGCQHESACLECLRNKYIHQAQTVHAYPLKCFHPDCQRLVQDAQIKRLAQSKSELRNYRHITSIIKINRANFGENWKDMMDLAQAMEGLNVCHCPSCNILIIKDGGCDHMTCFCGEEFDWMQVSLRPENQHPFPILVKNLLPTVKSITPTSDDEMEFDDDEEEIIDAIQPKKCENADFHSESRASCFEASNSTTISNHIDDDSLCVISELGSAADDSWDAISSNMDASQSSWEEISEVSSVQSFHSSSGKSFLEALQSCAPAVTSTIQYKTLPTIAESSIPTNVKPKRKKKRREEDVKYNEMFDAEFLYEGAKGARGGKAKFLFNHENNRKYWRYDQRRRSHARDYEYKWDRRHAQGPKYVTTY